MSFINNTETWKQTCKTKILTLSEWNINKVRYSNNLPLCPEYYAKPKQNRCCEVFGNWGGANEIRFFSHARSLFRLKNKKARIIWRTVLLEEKQEVTCSGGMRKACKPQTPEEAKEIGKWHREEEFWKSLALLLLQYPLVKKQKE